MKDVLDNIDEYDSKDESKINMTTAFIRYGICGFLGAIESKKIFSQFQWFSQNYNSELLESIIFNILGVIALILFIIYNISQSKIEKKVKYFIPELKKIKSILFIGYSFLMILYYLRISLLNINKTGIDFNSISSIIISSLILFIIIRELTYLNRSTKPKI